MTYDLLSYSSDRHVAIIRLNAPSKLNAMSSAMAAQLLDALKRGEREERAILLTGNGKAFCAGADLSEGGFDLGDPMRDIGSELDTLFNPIIYHMRNCRWPVVTAVRGAAAGVGCALALSGDIILASQSGYFLQAFRHIGLVPDGGSSYLLSRAVGRVRAMEMMLLGERVPAAKALEWGLINRLVADDTLDAEALALAVDLAAGPRSLGIIKRVAWAALDVPIETVLALERYAQREAGRSADCVEGITAFREKRRARFQGV